MDDHDRPLQDPADWAAENRNFTSDILDSVGARADLMQTDPGAAIRLLGEQLAGLGLDDPARLSDKHRIRLFAMLMAVVGEYLYCVHRVRWAWLGDGTPPLGGRWVVSALPGPADRWPTMVDVPGLCMDALASSAPVRPADLVNRAEELAGLRISPF
ncbi:hypothetical protein OH807_23350 [Kitasatospora sp. NBC_01560]|uniref:hypothetical protein n=1 Tax=Kitasatospora sp. NBC_01560 TaxID=2975965 RepID=UPI00386C0E58